MELKSSEAKYLRGLAHGLEPVVYVGKQGVTPSLIKSVEENLLAHELIKIKFNEFKEKEQKQALSAEIAKATKSAVAGMIGHIVILYKPNPDEDKRKIKRSA